MFIIVNWLQDFAYRVAIENRARSFQHEYAGEEDLDDQNHHSILSLIFLLAKWSLIVAFWPVSLLFYYCYLQECHEPMLYYAQTSFKMRSIVSRCAQLRLPFQPYVPSVMFNVKPLKWLFGSKYLNMSGHLQTILMELLRKTPAVYYRRELLQTVDGGEFTLDFLDGLKYGAVRFADDTPTMLILHGLTGGSHVAYVRHYIAVLAGQGVRSVVLNARGCGSSTLKSTRYFACHFTDDLRQAVDYLHTLYPNAPLFATGYSLGANILTKFLGEEGDSCKLVSALAISNPFDFVVMDDWLKQGAMNKYFYNFMLVKSLLNYLKRHQHIFPRNHSQYDFEHAMSSRTLQEYDERLTTKLWGYDTIKKYYQNSSGSRYLSKIRVPFVTIQALDDPILPETVIPYHEFAENPNLLLITTKYGGHVAWLENDPHHTNWADRVAAELVLSILDHYQASKLRSAFKFQQDSRSREVEE